MLTVLFSGITTQMAHWTAWNLAFQNVVVTFIDADGDTAATTTDANGNYTITAGVGNSLDGDVRIEFTLPGDGSLDFLQPGAAGGTTVQFANITTGGTVNVGFNNPNQYSEPDPELFTPIYIVQDNINGPE